MTKILVITDFYTKNLHCHNDTWLGYGADYLRNTFSRCGIGPSDYKITSVFPLYPPRRQNVSDFCTDKPSAIPGYPPLLPKSYLAPSNLPYLNELSRTIRRENPNIILCLGITPAIILSRKTQKISTSRGIITTSPNLTRPDGTLIKYLTTFNPRDVFADLTNNPICLHDLAKTARNSATPEFIVPSRKLHIRPTLADIQTFHDTHIHPNASLPWGVDIETKQNTITEISFCLPHIGLVVPFYSRLEKSGNYWPSANTEFLAWRHVESILHTIQTPVFQNGLYDITFLWKTLGIRVNNPEDTMLLHHAQQPEMKKSLGFLGSLYTEQPEWKTMRSRHGTTKKED